MRRTIASIFVSARKRLSVPMEGYVPVDPASHAQFPPLIVTKVPVDPLRARPFGFRRGILRMTSIPDGSDGRRRGTECPWLGCAARTHHDLGGNDAAPGAASCI